MNFEFTTANRIIFGQGRFKEIGNIAKSLGRKALVVTGSHSLEASGKLEELRDRLTKCEVEFFRFIVSAEPEIGTVELAMAKAREEGCDLVIGVGGGSCLDLAKAVAGLLTNEGELLDYLEVIGRGKILQRPAVPLIAVPTTAGTGSEVTNNSVIKDPKLRGRQAFAVPFCCQEWP
ncbi:MAG: iron-containing alcohol dehydrogenase [Thermoproteota archaeon]